MLNNTNNTPAPYLENDHNEAWIERQKAPEARRRYEQERLILWLAEELASAIEESGLSRREVAAKLGVSKARITQALNGRNLTLRTVADIAWATGCRLTMRREPLREGRFITCPVAIVRPYQRVITDTRQVEGRAATPELIDLLEAASP